MNIISVKSKAIAAVATKAVVTGFPGCMMQFYNVLKQHCSPVKVLHTLQLLARRLENVLGLADEGYRYKFIENLPKSINLL